MALTILEAAKQETGDIYRRGMIELFATSSGVLSYLPFENILGNAIKFNREETLPGIGFRGVNEGYAESTGIINPVFESLSIAGGDLDVDNFILTTQGEKQRTTHETMKTKALALSWERTFFKGSQALSQREFDGLQARLTGTQLLRATGDTTPTAGGDALSLFILDSTIDKVKDPTHIFMTSTLKNRLAEAARNPDVGGIITFSLNEFGKQAPYYNGIPIITVGNDNNDTPILGFNEVGPGGGAPETASLYVVSFSDSGVCGLQNGEIQVRDLGEGWDKPTKRTRIEWYSGFTIFHPKAAARMHGIKNVPVVR